MKAARDLWKLQTLVISTESEFWNKNGDYNFTKQILLSGPHMVVEGAEQLPWGSNPIPKDGATSSPNLTVFPKIPHPNVQGKTTYMLFEGTQASFLDTNSHWEIRFCFEKISLCSLGRSQIHSPTPLPSKCWAHRHVPPHPTGLLFLSSPDLPCFLFLFTPPHLFFVVVLRMEPRTLGIWAAQAQEMLNPGKEVSRCACT